MRKYQVEKIENGKAVYIADIVEAETEKYAIEKVINKITSYWGYCVYSSNDYRATIL